MMIDTTNERIMDFHDLEVDPFDAGMTFIRQTKPNPDSGAEWQRKIGAPKDMLKLASFLEFLESLDYAIEEVKVDTHRYPLRTRKVRIAQITTDKVEAPKKSNTNHSEQSRSHLVNRENM